jgi:hypothetical protein
MLLTLPMHARARAGPPRPRTVRTDVGADGVTLAHADAVSARVGSLVVRTTIRLPYVIHTR